MQLGHLLFACVTSGKYLQQQKSLPHHDVAKIQLIERFFCKVIETQIKLQDFRCLPVEQIGSFSVYINLDITMINIQIYPQTRKYLGKEYTCSSIALHL